MCIFAKNFWLGLALLSVLALGSGGCASSRPAQPGLTSRDSNSRPPQTGTNIPRRIRDGAGDPREKSRRTVKSKPAKEKSRPAKEKAKKPARTEVDEDVVIRGGFR